MNHIIIKSSTHHHTFICIIISVAVGWQRQREKARRWWHRNRYGALATTSCCFLWRSSYNSISYHIIPFHTIRPYLWGWREDCSLKKAIFLSPLSSPFIGELFCQRSSSCPFSLVVLWPLIGFHKVFPKCKGLTLHRSLQLMFFGEKLKIYGLLTPRLVCKQIRLNVARFSWTKNSQDAAFKEIAVNF